MKINDRNNWKKEPWKSMINQNYSDNIMKMNWMRSFFPTNDEKKVRNSTILDKSLQVRSRIIQH